MGCANSSPEKNVIKSKDDNNITELSLKSNPLSHEEIQSRIEAPKEAHTLTLAGITFKYAWVSQRGYYPEAPDKDNQDSYIILPSYGNIKDHAFFGVFDGHGKDGHHCSRYARDHLPKIVNEKLEKALNSPTSALCTPKHALTIAHYITNEAMHADKRFDDALSGTTSISILFRGKTMYISNVGDSRAIVISCSRENHNRLIAKPLSSDQTPYRKDERERVKKYGARILSMDQIEGIEPKHENWGDLNLGEDIDEGGDPPRVWSPNGDYPGTAFTRSFGDKVAEECGVVAEPEILQRDIEPNDRFIVIASDGVFEFLTNQMVADMLAQYSDPLDGCKAVVAAAYELWLQYEVRTDDITIVVLSVQDISTDVFSASSSFYAGAATATIPSKSNHDEREKTKSFDAVEVEMHDQKEARPVRRVMSREKKKNMIQLTTNTNGTETEENTQPLTEADMVALAEPKSELESVLISGAIKSNFLFQHLTTIQRNNVVGVMKKVVVSQGDWIIKQGDEGDRFYVVDTGKFEVRVKGAVNGKKIDDQVDSNLLSLEELVEIAGNVVHVYESGPNQHPGFGELSLMYGKPRAASVRALTEGVLWSLDRRIFKRVVLRPTDIRRDIIRTLKRVELFKCLNLGQLQRLTDLLNEDEFSEGKNIITQGEQGENFYIIVSGLCECSINSKEPGEPPKVVMKLKDYDYFGERALLESKPRAANVTVTSPKTKVLFIGKSAFEEVLGPLSKIIEEDRIRRESISAAKATQAVAFKDIEVSGCILWDSLGPLLLGKFGAKETYSNVTVRTFVLSDIERQGLGDSVVRYVDAAKVITNHSFLLANSDKQVVYDNFILPRCLSIIRDSNAIHLLFNTAVVADLSSLVRLNAESAKATLTYGPQIVALDGEIVRFVIASLISALETMHDASVMYRAIQPESINVDGNGRVVLMDYRVCKVGLIQGIRTFTVCGAADYLAPEQISQTGHTYPVDLWAMGVLLYELSVGSHPFSSNSEVATYSKISSFGSKSFPHLKFPESLPSEYKALINQLLMPTPEARIGASGGFSALKKHPFFSSSPNDLWELISAGKYPSPLSNLATQEYQGILSEGNDSALIEAFSIPFDDSSCKWLNNIEF